MNVPADIQLIQFKTYKLGDYFELYAVIVHSASKQPIEVMNNDESDEHHSTLELSVESGFHIVAAKVDTNYDDPARIELVLFDLV